MAKPAGRSRIPVFNSTKVPGSPLPCRQATYCKKDAEISGEVFTLSNMSDGHRKRDNTYTIKRNETSGSNEAEERAGQTYVVPKGRPVEFNDIFGKTPTDFVKRGSPFRGFIFDPPASSSPIISERSSSSYESVESGPFSLLGELNFSDVKTVPESEDGIRRKMDLFSPLSTPPPGSSYVSAAPDWSAAGNGPPSITPKHLQHLSKQSSLEQDDSLGILSPDQMVDFTISMDTTKHAVSALKKCTENTSTVDETVKNAAKSYDQLLWSRFCGIDCGVTMLDNQEFPYDESPHDSGETLDFDSLAYDARLDCTSSARERQKEPPKDLLFHAGNKTRHDADTTPLGAPADMSDRTISPEELPLDADGCDLHEDPLKPLNDIASENVEFSGAASGGMSSSTSVAPTVTSFVASVTSIASLDNGYQGDGEWSRPASRGADQSPTMPNRCQMAIRVKASMIDPMTDSDFFTESDADAHDEFSSVVGRGDRKAQVIDGTLYGSNGAISNNNTAESNSRVNVNCQQNQHTCKSFIVSTNEEMESSGVYSDFEKKPEDVDCLDDVDNLQQNETSSNNTVVASSISPAMSCKSSEKSQVQADVLNVTFIKEDAPEDVQENTLVSENNSKNQSEILSQDASISKASSNNMSHGSEIVNEENKVNMNETVKSLPAKDSSQPVKKYKMPKRNVASKIKAMIESQNPSKESASTEEENQENRRPARPNKPARKGGRWDAVMNKIAMGQQDNKLVPNRLKEVKSKVFAGISLRPSSPRPRSQNEVGTKGTSSTVMRFNKDNASLKSKSRSTRTRTTSASLHGPHQRSGRRHNSSSSTHSSNSDISTNQTPPTSKLAIGGSKKRDAVRSTSPLSDGSANSTTRVQTRSQTSAPHCAADSGVRNGEKKKQQLKFFNKGSKKKQNEKRDLISIKEKNGTNAPPTVVELKTPPVRKVPSRRTPPTANSTHPKPVPLRDHNRQQQQQPVNNIGKGTIDTRHVSKKTVTSEAITAPPQPLSQVALLLPHLKHGSIGFEALAVLLQYLVFDLDAFSTPVFKRELEKTKSDWLQTQLELEETRASYKRLEETHSEEVSAHQQGKEQLHNVQKDLERLKESHEHEIRQLTERHDVDLVDLKKGFQQQLQECRKKYENMLSEDEQKHEEKENSIVKEWEAKVKEMREEHHNQLVKIQEESTQKNEELQKRLSAVEEEYREEWRKATEKLQKDKDSKLQVTAGRCRELEDEVQSLQTVLELRSQELQESRKQITMLSRLAEELPAAQQRAQALQARVEDLQAQLKKKASFERQLSQENRLLMESFHQESKQKKRLSLHNEELQYKLKQREEYMLAALSGVSLKGNSSIQSLSDSFRSPIHHSSVLADQSISIHSRFAQDDISPPSSPKIKSIVEKSDSVAWVLEMEEDPEEVVSRLVRRAGSFRGINNSSQKNGSPVRARTLPPPKRPRCKGTSLCLSSSATVISPQTFAKSSRSPNTRCRSRSMSADSTEDRDYIKWVPQHPTLHKDNEEIENYFRHEANQNILKNGNLYHEDDFDFSQSIGSDLNLPDDSLSRMLPSDSSNEAESPSKCSSSGGSSSEKRKHKKGSRHKRKGVDSSHNLVSSTSDSLEPEVLPLPPLPGSSGDLAFLTTRLVKIPKESGGEAMISEETSEDENDRGEMNSSSDEQSQSDAEEQSSSSDSSLDPELIKASSGTKRKGLANQQKNSASKIQEQYQRLLLSDSGSPSAGTTAMDMSWSEDMEMMPSE